MTKSSAAVVALTFAATVAVTGWASASAEAQTRARPSSPPPSSGQVRSGSPAGPGRGAPPPSSPTGARSSAGHTVIGQATPNPSVGHGYYPGYPGHPGYCCGYYGGYYPYYPYYYYPYAFGLGFGWYGAYGAYWPYGYYDGSGYADAGGSSEGSHAPSHATGAIRLKVNVDTASVYVDGALVGKAGDFDGLTSGHLVLESGSHVLEIKAAGYETFNKTLTVEIGKTMTERVGLNKKKS
jgi:hypothetical protein